MASSSSILPDRFRGLRVLLVEPDRSEMQYHEHILSRNAYNVKSTTDANHGLSSIMKGERFECVLVDADISEMNIMEFLHRILARQPQLSVIIMACGDIHMRVTKEALSMGAVMCLRKPCAYSDISGIWKYVCTRKTTFPQANSNQNFPEENQALNTDDRPDSMVMPSTNIDTRIVIDNNISSSHHIQKGLNGMYGSMFNLVTNEDVFFSYDGRERIDGTGIQEITGTSTKNVADKGKQALEDDSNDQSEKYRKKRKVVNDHVSWTLEPHDKFVETVNSLGRQNAYPSSNIRQMNVTGLENNNIMSHPQDFQEREDTFKIPNKLAPWERENNLPVESNTWKRGSGSTLSDNNASVSQSSSPLTPLKLNSGGISFMIIANIKAKLQAAPPLFVPLKTTKTNNSHGNEETNYSFSEPNQPMQATTSSTFGDLYQPLKALTSSTFSGPYQPLKTSTNSSFGDHSQTLKGRTYMKTTTSYMTIENIKDKLLGAQPEPVPQVTTTVQPPKNSGVVEANDRCSSEKSPSGGQCREVEMRSYSYGNVMKQHVAGKNSSDYPFGKAMPSSGFAATTATTKSYHNSANNVLHGFGNGNPQVASGSGVTETEAPIDCPGIATDLWLDGVNGTSASVNHCFGNAMAPSDFGANLISDYNPGTHANNLSNGFAFGNSEGVGVSGFGDSLTLLDCFGNETNPCGASGGAFGASSDYPPEPLVSPAFFSYDLETLSHDFQGNQEDMFPDLPLSITLSDIDNIDDPNFCIIDSDIFGFL